MMYQVIKLYLLKSFFLIQLIIKSNSVKYGTLTCADGFISLDIYSKDVMLMVSFGIFMLQGKIIFVGFETSLNLFQQLVVLLWD